MVAYSFKSRFVSPIKAGLKRQTIRTPRYGRSRHACPGGPVTLLTGSRFKPELIGRAECADLYGVFLDFKNGGVRTINKNDQDDRQSIVSKVGLDDFAQRDGFADWEDMRQFWIAVHNVDQFEGVMIKWGDLIRD
jgi:hypothetical protein